MSLGSDLLTTRPLVEFADVTLADDDIKRLSLKTATRWSYDEEIRKLLKNI